MSSPISVFKTMAQDETLLRGNTRAVDRAARPGKVLFKSDFSKGFDGWRDHYNFQTPANPLSVVDYPLEGGLMVATAARPDAGYTDGYLPEQNCAAFKNLSRHFDGGLVSFSAHITHGIEGSTAALGSWFICIDTQAWDNNTRSFFKLQCGRNDTTGARSWGIIGTPGNSTFYGIPNSTVNTSGDNENKYNTDYVRLTVDITTGKYVECQINHKVFSLAGIVPNDTAPEPPQVGTPFDSFAGGLNFGLVVTAGPPGSGGAWVVMDKAIGTVNEA